jgi:hypothetical protein
MTSLLPLRELIVQKPRPETTLSLIRAFRQQAAAMVESYVFTATIRSHFMRILETVAMGHGQGFWVQAEYGAGKTHFLTALAALLSNTHDGLWKLVDDDEVRQYERRLQTTRLFPVIVSLRGMGTADGSGGRLLLDVLLEEGFQRALEDAGYADAVRVTSADDYVAWLSQTAPGIRNDVDAFVRTRTGRSAPQYREEEGVAALATLIVEYCRQHAINPQVASGVKDRLGHIYRQLMQIEGAPYNGLLVIIDEFEGWAQSHPAPQARAHDEDVLETLAYLLPRDLGYQVYTIVASQSAAPAKLQGGAAGDRFIGIPLLASSNERDYDIIISRRVRGLNEYRDPEIGEHYEYCRSHFEFAASVTPAEFRDVFPFQPRCFEVVRHITARDLPTTRSGLAVFHEVVNHEQVLARAMLIRVADLLNSEHLVADCLQTTVYQAAYRSYSMAREALPTLDLEASDLPLAQAVMDTLFLWHLAYLEQPRTLSLKDLAQATLTTSDFLRAEDNVAYVLGQMQPLRQIRFENQQASFVPTDSDGPAPMTIFAEYRRRALPDTYKLLATWTKSLFMTTRDTTGQPGLFNNFEIDQSKPFTLDVRNLQYSGEVVVASRWRTDHAVPLPKEDTHFRLVILTPDSADVPHAEQLMDPRIAVLAPAPLSEEAQRAAADVVAWTQMSEDFTAEKRSGREADAVRDWLATQKVTYLAALIGTHLRQYQAGRVITRDNIAINAHDFGFPSEDRRLAAMVEPVVTAAYPQLPVDWQRLRTTLRTAEMARVLNGYFSADPSTADKAATKNFGIALGLSSQDRPERFAPQQPAALELIAQMLRERNGELQTWRIFERLSAPPYGLPHALILLYLLAFVRRGDPRVEIVLKRGHKLRDANRTPFTGNKITANNVVALEYKNGMERDFDLLVAAAGPAWNDVVGYAREIAPDLRATNDQGEVENQSRRLAAGLTQLGSEVAQTRQNLEVLKRALGGSLPSADLDALDHLAALSGTVDGGYERFYNQASETYPATDDLRDERRALARLQELANNAAPITAERAYLERVRLRSSDGELETDRTALLGQLRLENLAAQPQLWNSLRSQFDQFRTRYRTAYQKHHRDSQDALTRLQETLADAPRRLQALALLNAITELGQPLGRDLPQRYTDLARRVQPCSVPFANLQLDAEPVCPQCKLTLSETPPQQDAEHFLRELEAALRDQQRRLASAAIRRVLAQSSNDNVQTFVQAVQTANVTALVDVMNEEVAAYIRKLLADEDVAAVKADVMRRFAEAYPTLEESSLREAVTRFEALLKEAFAAAHKEHPDKKTVRLTLR